MSENCVTQTYTTICSTCSTDDDEGNVTPVLRFSQAAYQTSESSLSVDVCVQSSVTLLESASATVTTTDITAIGMTPWSLLRHKHIFFWKGVEWVWTVLKAIEVCYFPHI